VLTKDNRRQKRDGQTKNTQTVEKNSSEFQIERRLRRVVGRCAATKKKDKQRKPHEEEPATKTKTREQEKRNPSEGDVITTHVTKTSVSFL
jgi:hypothetical protein